MKPRLTQTIFTKDDLLSTGSTLLNLACTGHIEGGLVKGGYFFLVGDSQSGKTFLSRTCLAEATINPQFKDYRIIYDDVEYGALMDTRRYFGDALADRMEPPFTDEDGPVYSETIEDFYFSLDDALNGKRPIIYVLDSMDGLDSIAAREKFVERKKAVRKGTKTTGSYGDGKARSNSSTIRSMLPRLRDTGSILLILAQTRDSFDASLFGPQQTFSGGHALKFYAMLQLWSSVGSKLKATVKGKERIIGINSRIRVKKNRATGRDRTIEVPIYYSHGIDDVGGCVRYLVNEGHWPKNKTGVIEAHDLGTASRYEELVKEIEEKGMVFDLRQTVADVWRDIEAACEVQRVNRYSAQQGGDANANSHEENG